MKHQCSKTCFELTYISLRIREMFFENRRFGAADGYLLRVNSVSLHAKIEIFNCQQQVFKLWNITAERKVRYRTETFFCSFIHSFIQSQGLNCEFAAQFYWLQFAEFSSNISIESFHFAFVEMRALCDYIYVCHISYATAPQIYCVLYLICSNFVFI